MYFLFLLLGSGEKQTIKSFELIVLAGVAIVSIGGLVSFSRIATLKIPVGFCPSSSFNLTHSKLF